MSQDKSAFSQRKHVRYPPDKDEVAHIQYDPSGDEFLPDAVGLIVEHSAIGGCCLAILEANISPGATCRIKIGRLEPYLSKTIWKKPLERGVDLLGFKFLE